MTIHVLTLNNGSMFLFCPSLTLNGIANECVRKAGIPYLEGSARERTIYRSVDLFKPADLQRVVAILRLNGYEVEVEE